MTDSTTSRRSFIAATGTALIAAACAPAVVTRRDEHDLVVRNGMLFDGTGTAGRELDLAITNGRIAGVGPGLARGREEIDARGLAVAPVHRHPFPRRRRTHG